MTRFTEEALKEASKMYAVSKLATQNFLNRMGYKDGTPKDACSLYDNIEADAKARGINVGAFIPSAIPSILSFFKDSPLAKKQILDSIGKGIEEYRLRHGGAMPSTDLVSSALEAANVIYTEVKSQDTGGIFDSATNAVDVNSEIRSFYDSVTSQASTHIADVPALAMVTITMLIANASPIVAYLPNPKGTQTLPLLYVSHIAGRNYGQMQKGDPLDGVKASLQYFDSVHKFALTSADQTTFKVISKRQRDKDNKPTGAERLPLVVGANRAYLNGILVGTDEYQTGKKPQGVNKFEPKDVAVKIAGVEYKLASGTHNSDTDEITLVFDKALPAGAKVEVLTVADFERTDNTGKDILVPPNTDIDLEYTSVSAYAVRAIYTATIDALMQMQNELGVDMRAAFVAIVIAKLLLEQNTRLLIELSQRAEGLGNVRDVDLTRGSDITAAFNKTSDIGAEILPAVEDAKRRVVEDTRHRPMGFDIYVTGALGTLMNSLTDDTHFVSSSLSFGMPNEIIRLGAKGTDNYYYVPTTSNILQEGEITVQGTQGVFSEMLLVARNGEAAKSVCVGHVAVPPITGDVRSQEFKQGVTYFSKTAAQVNDNQRYANQVFKLRVLNLPKSLTTSKAP